MTFSSSTLTKLCINVYNFNDCLALLDGRLKQLTTFIVQVELYQSVDINILQQVSLYSVLFSFSS